MTDQEIVDRIVGEVNAYNTAVEKWRAAVTAWQTRRDNIIDEVVQKTGLSKDEVVRRVASFIDPRPEFHNDAFSH